MKVFYYNYRPFIMGGSPHQYVACDVPVEGPHDLGKGFEAYTVTTPSGRLFVIEATTGAVISDSLQQAQKDVEDGDSHTMNQQIEKAKEWMQRTTTVAEEQFWTDLDQLPAG